jgi:hypothetical protein
MSPRFPPSERKGTGSQAIGRRSGRVDTYNLLKDNKVVPYTENAVGSGLINPFNTAGRRITDGLLSIWWFTEGTGSTIFDRAGLTTATDLTILSGTEWTQDASYSNRYFLNLSAGGHVQASTDELYNAMQAKVAAGACNEFTIEAWIKPTNTTQNGPARIMTLAANNAGTSDANFMVGQGGWTSVNPPTTVYDVRVRSDSVTTNGPDYRTPGGTATTNLQHVVFTVSGDDSVGGVVNKIYIDGVIQTEATTDYYASDTSINFIKGWSAGYNLDIGNTIGSDGSDRQWLGGIYLMSMYNRALTAGEVVVNYYAGVTTDSILPTPTAGMSNPLFTSGFANGTNMSCSHYVGGIRSVEVEVSYGVSSAEGLIEDTDYTVVTDKTQSIAPTEYSKSITLKPLVDCSKDGTATITLSSISIGSLGPRTTHVMSFSSLASSVAVSFATSTLIISPLASTRAVSFNLDRPSNQEIDVCCVGLSGASNAGTYYMIDANDSTLKSFDGASYAMGTVASGTTGVGANSTFNLSADPLTGFVPGDVLYLSTLAASSVSGTSFHTITTPSALSATVGNIVNTSKPNEFNTGISALGWSIDSLKSPLGEPWYDDSTGQIDQDGVVIVGYNFSLPGLPLSYIYLRAHDVTFSGCYVKSRGPWGFRGNQKVKTGAKDSNPSGIKMYYSEICADGTYSPSNDKLVNRGFWDTMHRSHLHHSYGDIFIPNSLPAEGIPKTQVVTTISENYMHRGAGSTGGMTTHADGIQWGGSTSGMVIVSGNNIWMPKKDLITSDKNPPGSKICNCYAPKDSFGADWGSNFPVYLTANEGYDNPTGYYLGHAYVCDNWINGGNASINAGASKPPDVCGDVTVSGNKFGRDFYNYMVDISPEGTYTGTTIVQDNVWEDDGTPAVQGTANKMNWYSRYRCVNETGLCPESTWNCDANDPCDCSSGLFCI